MCERKVNIKGIGLGHGSVAAEAKEMYHGGLGKINELPTDDVTKVGLGHKRPWNHELLEVD